MDSSEAPADLFDFDMHREKAESDYRLIRGTYEDLAEKVEELLRAATGAEHIRVHSIESRAKTVESFGDKAVRPSKDDPEKPYYPDPMSDIEDQAGCRVITFFLKDVPSVGSIVQSQFDVVSTANRSAFLREGGERLGYESVHYVVKINEDRLNWPEYARFRGLKIEIQVRTILQHAWAEIEHDIQYKASEALPAEIRRRFLALAGMVEVSDREFQAIADAYDSVSAEARRLIAQGKYEQVEITPESLREFLDARFGPDGRMSVYSYAWTARNLKRMGFVNLNQLETCIADYDADAVSRAMHGTRQGQLNRLEDVVAAGMGENYLRLHPWARDEDSDETPEWLERYTKRLSEKLKELGTPAGNYNPNQRVE